MLLPILIGFCLVGINLWGTAYPKFRTFSRAFLQILLMSIGCFDTDLLNTGYLYTSFTFILLFYALLVTFFVAILYGIFIDSYRIVIMDYGFTY